MKGVGIFYTKLLIMAIIKTDEEIKKLKAAAKLGEDCFSYICTVIKAGMTEKEISKIIYEFFMKNGADKLSFDSIVGSGVNSAQIHSTPTDRKIQENDIILFDIGCVLDGYCSDMSRTVFIGKPTHKQIEIYNLVYETYLNAINNIKVGMPAKVADNLGRQFILDKGYDYAHALGHGVGTEVHENPLLSPKREEILDKNMTFSIEPGIYIENEFGVRVEDVGVLTNDGLEMFSIKSKEIIIL